MDPAESKYVVPGPPNTTVYGGGGAAPPFNLREQSTQNVLPDYVFDVITEFGLSSSAVKALQSSFRALNNNPNGPVIDPLQISTSSTPEELIKLFKKIGLYLPSYAGAYNSLTSTPFVFSFQNFSAAYPGPAKFYNNNIRSDRWILPVPPANFSISNPSTLTEITTLNGASYSHAGPEQLEEITFESFFPAVSDIPPDFIPEYISFDGNPQYGYHSPNEWVVRMVQAARSNQPLIFSVYAAGTGFQIQGGRNMVIRPVSVSVSSFDWSIGSDVGGSRFDISYSITLKRWKQQTMSITNFVKQPQNNPLLWPSTGSGGGNLRKYKTRARDTLQKIAQKRSILGNSNRWKEIYNYSSNKQKIRDDYARFKKRSPQSRFTLSNYPISAGINLSIPKR